MVDADEGGVRDDVERLGAPVFGMSPPADVGEQAGGVPETRFLLRLADVQGGERSGGPFHELVRMRDRPRAQKRKLLRRRDQGVAALLLRVEQREQEAFAHAERRDDDPRRPHCGDDFLQHHGPVWQQRAACLRHALDALDLLDLAARHLAQEGRRLLHPHFVVMHHGERIGRGVHVEPRQISPRPADGIEGPARARPSGASPGRSLHGRSGRQQRASPLPCPAAAGRRAAG